MNLLHADIDDIIDAEYEAEEQPPFRNITVDGAVSISNPKTITNLVYRHK